MALVYQNGAVDIERYDSFGIEASDNVGRFGFTGQMRLPELQLAYYKNRMYDPAMGRFLSPDPLGMVDGPNLYAYVLNDPVNSVDPWGLAQLTADDNSGVWGDSSPVGAQGSGGIINVPGQYCGGQYCVRGSWAIQNFLDQFSKAARNIARATEGFCIEFCDETAGVVDFLGNVAIGLDIVTGPSGEGLVLKAGARGASKGLLRLQRSLRNCACFTAGTMVATPEGLVPIETLSVGDLVLAYDEKTGKTEPKPVTDLIRPEPKETFLLAMTDAQGERETFEATADHPWLVLTSDGEKRWVETLALAPGDRLLAGDGETLTLDAKTLQPELVQTYNLTVADHHTFLVGEDGVVVHNCLTQRASALAAQLGKHRVQIRDASGRLHQYDLAGKPHFDKAAQKYIATPHVRVGTPHTGPNGRVSYTWELRSMTEADLRTVNRFLGE